MVAASAGSIKISQIESNREERCWGGEVLFWLSSCQYFSDGTWASLKPYHTIERGKYPVWQNEQCKKVEIMSSDFSLQPRDNWSQMWSYCCKLILRWC